MSKRIVLKSVLAVVVAGFILSVSSCQKDEKKIIGTWKYQSVEVKEFACSDPLMTMILKPYLQQNLGGLMASGVEVEFNKDGRVISRNAQGGGTATYKASDSKLTITTDGVSETYDLSFPDKKTMCWDMKMDKEMLDSISEALTYFFEEEVQVTKCSVKMTLVKQ